MPHSLKAHSHSLHGLTFSGSSCAQVAMLSDLHWDNPRCNRKILARHLDYCLEQDMPIMLNGGTFCMMQGKSDRRGSMRTGVGPMCARP